MRKGFSSLPLEGLLKLRSAVSGEGAGVENPPARDGDRPGTLKPSSATEKIYKKAEQFRLTKNSEGSSKEKIHADRVITVIN